MKLIRRFAPLLFALGSACAVAAHAPVEASVRAATYNIEAGAGNLDRTAAAIRSMNADLVGLQEVDVHWSTRSGFADQAEALATKLGMQVKFAGIYTLPGADATSPPREFGVALLSRYPILEFHNRTITRLPTQPEGAPATPMPGMLDATVDVNGTRVRVLDTHLDYRADPKIRARQVDETLAILAERSMPTILFGDLNAGPDALELQPLLRRMHDSWIGPDSGLSYPADKPAKRIDFVLTSSHFHVRSAHVIDTQASDHRPVVVELTLP